MMKRLVFTIAMTLIVGVSFGQKKAVNSAKGEIKGSTPNIEEARKLIKGALTNPETENQAETWYVAGSIENKQLDLENSKEILGEKPNLGVMYNALMNIYPYFEKAYELDMQPDAKGRVKSKFAKDIKAIMKANRIHYVNAGVHFYDTKDYAKAYTSFKLYGDMPHLPMMLGEEFPESENDSLNLQIRYYAGLAASQIPDRQAAIAIYSEIKDKGYAENEIYQRLCHEYEQLEDSVNLIKTMKEGVIKFPGDEFFLMNLINISLSTGNIGDAVALLKDAVEQTPNSAQLHNVLGQVYEAEKNIDSAIESLKKAAEMEPDNAEYLSHIGRVYYNLGVDTRAKADENITNDKLYSAELKKAQDYFKEAIPYFERSYELNPKNNNTIYALRSIYYSLNMNEEYKKMDAIYSEQ